MNYDEYLNSLGLTADERKIMDTPARRATYEGTISAITAERDAEKTKRVNYEGQVQTWYEKTVSQMSAKDREVITSKSETARLAAAIKAAKESGIEGFDDNFLKTLGIEGDMANNRPDPNANKPPVDLSNYYNKDEIRDVAEGAANQQVVLADITNEHRALFGTVPSFVALRAEAKAAKMGLQDYWMQKFNVAAKRTEVQNNEIKAREDAIRKEERERIQAEYASKGVNPDLANPGVSMNPFKPVTREGVRDGQKQPWEYGNQSNERVSRALNAWQKNPASHSGPVS